MNPAPATQELTVTSWKVQFYGIFAAVAVFLLLSLPFERLHGQPIFRFEALTQREIIAMLVVGFAGIAVHELIHGLTAIWYAGIAPGDAKFGFQWKSMTPYFHSKVPIAARKYRVVVLMPLVLMGMIPYIAGMVAGNGWVVAFGVLFIIAAGGDLLILWLMRGLGPERLVQDHPEKIGLIVS